MVTQVLLLFVVVVCFLLLLFSHIYQPVVDSLSYVAQELTDSEARQELTLKSLQLFVQQGIEAKRASDKADITHKVWVCRKRGRGLRERGRDSKEEWVECDVIEG